MTLIESEAVQAAGRDYNVDADPGDARRNIVTSGVPLNHLVDSEFVVGELGVESLGGAWEGRVTYHDSCHGLRELGLSGQGRSLLRGIEGLELVEMAWPDRCCGFGGTFSLRLPDVASAMADEKMAQADATGADVMVTGDSGCLMHLAGRANLLRANPATFTCTSAATAIR